MTLKRQRVTLNFEYNFRADKRCLRTDFGGVQSLDRDF